MSRRTLLIIRWGIFLAAAAFLYQRLRGDQGTASGWAGVMRAMAEVGAWFWPTVVLLTLVNWGLEAIKWRWLVAPLQRMGFQRAFAATLAGTAIGLVTPNRTGEFVGRVLFLDPSNRWQGGFATVLGSISQFVATVVMGVLALLLRGLWAPGMIELAPWLATVLTVLSMTVGGAALLLFLRPVLLRQFVGAMPVLRRLHEASHILEQYTTAGLLAILALSMARYLVFWLQYVLFLVLLADIGWGDALIAVPLIFLAVTLVPTMMLTEMGVRGSVAVALLAPVGGLATPVLLASFGVWAANLALPAAAGALIMLVARIRTRP